MCVWDRGVCMLSVCRQQRGPLIIAVYIDERHSSSYTKDGCDGLADHWVDTPDYSPTVLSYWWRWQKVADYVSNGHVMEFFRMVDSFSFEQSRWTGLGGSFHLSGRNSIYWRHPAVRSKWDNVMDPIRPHINSHPHHHYVIIQVIEHESLMLSLYLMN